MWVGRSTPRTRRSPGRGRAVVRRRRRRDGYAGFGGEAMRRGRVVSCRALLFLCSVWGMTLRGEIPPACRNKLFMQFCIIRAAEHRVPCLYSEDVRIILLDRYVEFSLGSAPHSQA